ncbi:MAG: hypothetical protein L6Q92_13735 [Phycisphaerae bacterium]|nr:hypothetical protein [Phycisphaerae bacterium]
MAHAPLKAAGHVKPRSDVYTVLIIIAFAFLAGGVGFMVYRMLDLYGTILPPAGG